MTDAAEPGHRRCAVKLPQTHEPHHITGPPLPFALTTSTPYVFRTTPCLTSSPLVIFLVQYIEVVAHTIHRLTDSLMMRRAARLERGQALPGTTPLLASSTAYAAACTTAVVGCAWVGAPWCV